MISIRRRLLLWLLSILIVMGVVASTAIYIEAQEEMGDLFDHQLHQIGLTLLRQSTLSSVPPLRLVDEDELEESPIVSQVWDSNGKLVYNSHPVSVLPHFSAQGLATIVWKNESWRIFTAVNRRLTVQVAQPLLVRQKMSADIGVRLLIPVLILFPMMALLVWVAVGRGLLPLRRIAGELGKRNPSSLEPLSMKAIPEEAGSLVAALNDLLYRLEDALLRQRQFIADAAHELRTPLTAVNLQAQIVGRAANAQERAMAMGSLKLGIARVIHLVQQLLIMSRLEPEAMRRSLALVELEPLIKLVLIEHAPLAHDKNIDLGLAHMDSTSIMGDADNLRIMLGNLIDNAIRYTPGGGRVDVSLRAGENHILLEVQDNGPGIPTEERLRVFDRFYRQLGSGEQGSGLGLAIVKKIADHHQAEITLDERIDRAGLQVTVRFRRG